MGTGYFSQRVRASFSDRAAIAKAPAAKKLFQLMQEKRSNLAFAVDVTNSADVLRLARDTAEEIAVLKTHVDAIGDYSQNLIGELSDLAKQHSFLLFEDRKFADIGTTVKMQYGGGIYKIADWSHLVTVHSVPGVGVVEGLLETAKPRIANGAVRGCVLLAQMSSKGNLATGEYTARTVEMAQEYPEFACGFIGTGSVPQELKKLAEIAPPQFAILTPGVQLVAKAGELKQQYSTPLEAVGAGSDCIIVGGGIFKAQNPKSAAGEYRDAAWTAYLQRAKQ
jgi:uridine monophosphate synthetase